MRSFIVILLLVLFNFCQGQIIGSGGATNVMSGASVAGLGPTTTITGPATANTVYTVEFTFASSVSSFVSGDITVTGSGGGTKSNFQTISGSAYTVDITPSANGTINVSVAAGVCVDGFGRNNQASNTLVTTTTLIPVNTVAPVISGTVNETGHELSTTNGTWLNSPSSYSYQWRRDGVDIGSATSSAYTTTGSDDGKSITCYVTATNAAGSAGHISNSLAVGFSAVNADFWLDCTKAQSSSIAGDTDSLLRESLTSSDLNAYTSSSISPGTGLRFVPSYNGEGVYFDGFKGWTYGSSSTWNGLHNGGAFTVYILLKQLPMSTSAAPVPILRTTTTSTTLNNQTGLMVQYYHPSVSVTSFHISITNSAGGTPPYQVIGSTNAITVNAYNILKVTFTGSSLTAWVKPFGGSYTQIGQDNTGSGLSGSNSTSPLNIGATTTNKCYLKHVIVFKRALTGSEETTIQGFLDAEAAETVTPTEVNLYFHWGQSNDGSADNAGIAPDLEGRIGAKTYFLTANSGLYKSGFWAEIELGVNQNPSTNLSSHAWPMRFGKDMNEIAPTYIAGRWIGSSVLIPTTPATASWSALSSSSNIDHFPYLTDGFYTTQGNAGVCVAALDELVHITRKIPLVKGLIIVHGESDAGSSGGSVGANYETELKANVTGFIDKISAAGYDVSEIRIAILRVSAGRVPNGDAVRTAQANTVTYLQTTYFGDATRATLINMDDAANAGGHYTAAGWETGSSRLITFFSPYAN